jgi:hypothetical protein
MNTKRGDVQKSDIKGYFGYIMIIIGYFSAAFTSNGPHKLVNWFKCQNLKIGLRLYDIAVTDTTSQDALRFN